MLKMEDDKQFFDFNFFTKRIFIYEEQVEVFCQNISKKSVCLTIEQLERALYSWLSLINTKKALE
jgi:hypothetical protein